MDDLPHTGANWESPSAIAYQLGIVPQERSASFVPGSTWHGDGLGLAKV